MPLNKQTVHLPLGSLDTSDPHVVKPGNFSVLDNVTVEVDGRQRPRGPWTTLPYATVDARTAGVGSVRDMFGAGDNLAARTRDGEVFGFAKSLNKWQSGGFMPRASLRSDILRSDNALVSANTEIMDSVVANNQLWVVWSTETYGVAWEGSIYVSCYDLGTGSDPIPGPCLLDAYNVTAQTWSFSGISSPGSAGVAGCLPHLTKCSRSATDDTVLLSCMMKSTAGGSYDYYMLHLSFATASPATAPTAVMGWLATNNGGSYGTAPMPYDVIEVADTTGAAGRTTVLCVANLYVAGWATVVVDVFRGVYQAASITGGRPDGGLMWLAKTASQTAYVTFAASGTGTGGACTGLWLYKVALPGLGIHSSTGALQQITATTTVRRMTGWSENAYRDVVIFANGYQKQDGANVGATSGIITYGYSQTYNTTTTTALGQRWNIWPVSRAFKRVASDSRCDWSFWVTYLGENLGASTGAVTGGTNDQQQVYFCMHGATNYPFSAHSAALFDIIAKCHHDQALVTRRANYKETNAYFYTAWSTNVSQVRLADSQYAPITSMVLPRETEVYADGTAATALPGYAAMAAVRIDWDPTDLSEAASIAKTSLLPGGIVDIYNGRTVADAGCVVRPETPGLVAAAGGTVTAGTHSVVVCWVTRDADGNIWRSAPSPANSITVGAPNQTVRVYVQTPGIMDASAVTAEIYMTRAASTGDTMYYFAGTGTVDRAGGTGGTTSTVLVAVSIADASLAIQPTLYTASGELPNDCATSAAVITVAKNRVWLAGCEDRDQLRYSKLIGEDTGIGWSDGFYVDIQDGEGDITALAGHNERLFVFKRRRIYVLSGDGPDDTGVGAFGTPELVTSAIGCVDPRSICVIPEGVLFCAETGIHLVDGGSRISEVGAPVNTELRGLFGAGNPVRIGGVAVVPNTSLVAFAPAIAGGGPRSYQPSLYVFDRKRGTWATWSVPYAFLLSNNAPSVYASTASLYYADGNADSGRGNPASYAHALGGQYDVDYNATTRAWDAQWTTGWFALPALGDYERLHTIQARLRVPFGPSEVAAQYSLSWTIETDDSGAAGALTESLDNTVASPSGTTELVVQVRPKYQKGDRFRITLVASGNDDVTVSLELIGIDLIVAGKGGLQRVPAASLAT